MNRTLFGGALGAMAMYFFDPEQGRRRRALTRDRVAHAAKVAGEAGTVGARAAAHRAQGPAPRAPRLLPNEPGSDGGLVERAPSAPGRAESHSHAIRAFVATRHVCTSG